MSVQSAFQPKKGANQKITASTTAADVAIGEGSKSMRFVNVGANVIFVRTYKSSDGTETATNADTPLGPTPAAGCVLIIEKPQDHDRMSYLAETGSTIFHAQPGEGGV